MKKIKINYFKCKSWKKSLKTKKLNNLKNQIIKKKLNHNNKKQ